MNTIRGRREICHLRKLEHRCPGAFRSDRSERAASTAPHSSSQARKAAAARAPPPRRRSLIRRWNTARCRLRWACCLAASASPAAALPPTAALPAPLTSAAAAPLPGAAAGAVHLSHLPSFLTVHLPNTLSALSRCDEEGSELPAESEADWEVARKLHGGPSGSSRGEPKLRVLAAGDLGDSGDRATSTGEPNPGDSQSVKAAVEASSPGVEGESCAALSAGERAASSENGRSAGSSDENRRRTAPSAANVARLGVLGSSSGETPGSRGTPPAAAAAQAAAALERGRSMGAPSPKAEATPPPAPAPPPAEPSRAASGCPLLPAGSTAPRRFSGGSGGSGWSWSGSGPRHSSMPTGICTHTNVAGIARVIRASTGCCR